MRNVDSAYSAKNSYLAAFTRFRRFFFVICDLFTYLLDTGVIPTYRIKRILSRTPKIPTTEYSFKIKSIAPINTALSPIPITWGLA
jgi:hypothetical protein